MATSRRSNPNRPEGRTLTTRACGPHLPCSWPDDHTMCGENVAVKVDDHGVDALRYGIKTTQGTWQPRLRPAA